MDLLPLTLADIIADEVTEEGVLAGQLTLDDITNGGCGAAGRDGDTTSPS